ncbi:NmrA family NAD(P)-binding protein [Flavobacterium sp.]|uniref:NmrA family NAD(P)-binding protein n=1 Tax=Flavobacterium sp. TaxID=239 RepID=UPI002632F720|nr:NmrA family NAD(P)-binding protein [Flavobacterium sp.]
MKITLTGAAGNITKPLAEKLLAQGHSVTVIGRNAENLKPLTDIGAETAIGSIEDDAFIANAFKGADVVYTMIPVPYHRTDWVEYGELIGENYRNAIAANGIKKVVNLSTYGAHKLEGIGAINSIGQLEKSLNKLNNIEVIHLRAGYFYSNLFRQIDTLNAMGVIGANYGSADGKMIFVHTQDIADVAFEAITNSAFPSNEPYYVVSDIRTWHEAAKLIGKAIGKDLNWTVFSDEQFGAGAKQAGFPDFMIAILIEIGQGIATGKFTEHYFSLNSKPALGKTKLENFAKEFAVLYNS